MSPVLKKKKLRHFGRGREFLSQTDGKGVSVYPFNVSAKLLCEVPPDAATATAQVREFGFRTGIQPLYEKLDVVDSGL